MVNLSEMVTEGRNPNSMGLDTMTALEIVTVMNNEDAKVAAAVREQLPQIAAVAEMAAKSLSSGARLIYLGAGTSGRLGLLDSVECPPTFGVSADTVVGLIAGGERAFIKAVEGAEDNAEMCVSDLKAIGLTAMDTVVGIAASGRTPYVIGGLDYARKLGCKVAAIAGNKNSAIAQHADVAVEIVTGPEVLSGSTRLKAGTAQKMALNMISTAAMVQIGKVYENLMVDVMQTNEKLYTRAENIVMEATGTDRDTAKNLLKESNGSVKEAIVMLLHSVDHPTAVELLEKSNGHIRRSLG